MLTVSDLLRQAREQEALEDYGDSGFLEGLRVLVDSINAEAELSAENEARVEEYLLRVLRNRLRMQRDMVRHPEIADEKILPPVFITGMPRTGSTTLHRMLAATGDFNTMTFWQAHDFARVATHEVAGPDPRIAAAARYLEWIRERSPRMLEGHPMYAEEAEEETGLLDAGFNSLYRYASLLNVPSYVRWVLQLDGLQAFRDLRVTLQYLQWQHWRGSSRRWLLKSPALFGFESAFAAVFPGMDFIVAHRDPAASMASACDLNCAVRRLYNDDEPPRAAVGAAMMSAFGAMAERHLRWRATYPEDKAMDVAFAEIVGDQRALLRRIYRFLGMPLDTHAEAGMLAWLDREAARAHHGPKASLADYGLVAEDVDESLAAYIERYSLHIGREGREAGSARERARSVRSVP